MPAREQIFKATALASSDKVLATPFSFFRQETKPLLSCFSNRSIATDFSRTTRCYPIIETNRTNCASFSHLSKNYFNYPIVSFRPFIPRTRRTSDVPSRRASTCLASLPLSLSLAFFNSLCRGPSALRRLFVTPKFIRCLPRLSLKHRPSFSFLLNRFIPLYPAPLQTRILSRSPTRASSQLSSSHSRQPLRIPLRRSSSLFGKSILLIPRASFALLPFSILLSLAFSLSLFHFPLAAHSR